MANEIRTFLAKQVIERRKKSKLSQAALSKLTNLSIARISEIERAIANPTLDTLETLAKVFNVSLTERKVLSPALSWFFSAFLVAAGFVPRQAVFLPLVPNRALLPGYVPGMPQG